MFDAPARNLRNVRRQKGVGVGGFRRRHNKLLSTKLDEAINSLLLFRLPAHSESPLSLGPF